MSNQPAESKSKKEMICVIVGDRFRLVNSTVMPIKKGKKSGVLPNSGGLYIPSEHSHLIAGQECVVEVRFPDGQRARFPGVVENHWGEDRGMNMMLPMGVSAVVVESDPPKEEESWSKWLG